MSQTVRRLVLVLAACLPGVVLQAATYLPGPDVDLARRAPLVVRAFVVSQESRLENLDGQLRPFTYVTLERAETIKGALSADTFSVRLAGGHVGDEIWWVPGTPIFSAGSEVVLLLSPAPGHPGPFRLTEFGLSKYDLVTDDGGRRFAVRSAFGPREDVLAAAHPELLAGIEEKSAAPARDAESFLAVLRALARGENAGEPVWAVPTGRPGRTARELRPKWVNIGGREPGDCGDVPCLFRWFWSTGASANGVVSVTGTQSNLTNDESTCGTDSACDVQNAIDQWHGVAGTDVRYSGISASGNVSVLLDALQSQDGTTWTTALGCGGGVVGLGGPGSGGGPRTYRGDGNYYAPSSGTVSMRKVTCNMGYSARTFRSAVLHEVGHTLGLGHPDLDESTHSTTSQGGWNAAVMHSVVPSGKPDSPQTDDIQAIQYLYTTGSLGTLPVANFSFTPASPMAGSPVAFTDSSTGSPISWTWSFGDPASGASNSSTEQNPSHAFSGAGTYTVSLSSASATGTGSVSKSVTVAAGASGCVPNATTLCLNNSRFQVRAAWRTKDGNTGLGTGVGLTSDSGYFWFFNAANIEVVTKVLNACAVNNHYWAFASGLTNVEVTLTVTDTQNGTVKPYVNPLGTPYAPVQDTSAFATCP